jgi:PIN domain nuclease of toxin-antitoxin system
LNLLLDTHVLIWILVDSPSLGPAQRRIVDDEENRIFVSAASMFEMFTKQRIGKLILPPAFLAQPESIFDDFSFSPLQVTPGHAALAGKLEGDHRDPFDRLVAAQSMAEKMPVMTVDIRIKELGARVVW